jgi:hypothetical protein
MSRQQQSRLRVAFEIERYDILIDIACERCSLSGHSCIVMKDFSSRLKCSECVCASKSCVNMSWSFLDHSREDLFAKIAKDEAVLAIVIIWLLRNKKILKKIDAKTKRKARCLLSGIKESNASKSSNCFAANALVESSSAFWSSLAMLNDFSNVDEIAE